MIVTKEPVGRGRATLALDSALTLNLRRSRMFFMSLPILAALRKSTLVSG